MDLINKTLIDFDSQKGVVPPMPGQNAHYKCSSCGERFTAKVPIIFSFLMRCPKCGSFRIGRDMTVIN